MPRTLIALVLLLCSVQLWFHVDAGLAVGVHDWNGQSWVNPNYQQLISEGNGKHVRIIVPYDIALNTTPYGSCTCDHSRCNFDAWLANASAAGVEPYVVFQKHIDMTTCSDTQGTYVPANIQAFQAAFQAFLDAYGKQVGIIGAWNEPANAGEWDGPGGAQMAANVYGAVVDMCPSCVVLAGEFADLDIQSQPDYVNAYITQVAAIGKTPVVWAFHDYVDLKNYVLHSNHCPPGNADCVARMYLKVFPPGASVWVTEAGAEMSDMMLKCNNDTTCAENYQAEAIAFLYRFPTIDARITRIYYYRFQDVCTYSTPNFCPFADPGLMTPCNEWPNQVCGSQRLSLQVVQYKYCYWKDPNHGTEPCTSLGPPYTM